MLLSLPALILSAHSLGDPIGQFQMKYPFPDPANEYVYFQGDWSGRFQLYRLSLEDDSIEAVLGTESSESEVSVSPDGRMIAFTSDRTGNPDIYVADVESGRVLPVAPHPGKDGHARWSPDGEWLVFNRTINPTDMGGSDDAAIFKVRPDGRDLTLLSDSENVETFASFSPDGEQVVFVEWFRGHAPDQARNGDLVIVDLASGSRSRLTNSAAFDAYPYWGASGEWIYFSSIEQAPGAERPEFNIMKIRPDGTDLMRLSALNGASEVRAVPSRDETEIFYNFSDEQGSTRIGSLPLES